VKKKCPAFPAHGVHAGPFGKMRHVLNALGIPGFQDKMGLGKKVILS
jgi:hypothetical protein